MKILKKVADDTPKFLGCGVMTIECTIDGITSIIPELFYVRGETRDKTVQTMMDHVTFRENYCPRGYSYNLRKYTVFCSCGMSQDAFFGTIKKVR